MSIYLKIPTINDRLKAENFKREFYQNQEMIINGSALLDKMDYHSWINHINNQKTAQKGWVPATTFFAIRKSDNKIVGIIDIRHELNKFLEERGGHIGYSVCPYERRKGYATEMLKLALEYSRKINLDKVMICCLESNLASKRVIEKCGGIYTSQRIFNNKHILIYWIEL